MKFLYLLFFVVSGCGSSLAADAKLPAADDCDRSVIPSSVQVKTVVSPNKGPRWNALAMDNGTALCVFGSRYPLFGESIEDFKGADSGDIFKVYFKAEKGETVAYHINKAKLVSAMEPFRGEQAWRFYALRAVYDDAAMTSVNRASVVAGRDFERNWKYFSGNILKNNWLWSNAKVKAKLNKWLDAQARKKYSVPADCQPSVEILTGIPRSYLSGYLAERSPKSKLSISSRYKITVARMICAGNEDDPQSLDREKLHLDALLELMR